jgi:hypothetical protein
LEKGAEAAKPAHWIAILNQPKSKIERKYHGRGIKRMKSVVLAEDLNKSMEKRFNPMNCLIRNEKRPKPKIFL